MSGLDKDIPYVKVRLTQRSTSAGRRNSSECAVKGYLAGFVPSGVKTDDVLVFGLLFKTRY
jgi:hypothetical protein